MGNQRRLEALEGELGGADIRPGGMGLASAGKHRMYAPEIITGKAGGACFAMAIGRGGRRPSQESMRNQISLIGGATGGAWWRHDTSKAMYAEAELKLSSCSQAWPFRQGSTSWR